MTESFNIWYWLSFLAAKAAKRAMTFSRHASGKFMYCGAPLHIFPAFCKHSLYYYRTRPRPLVHYQKALEYLAVRPGTPDVAATYSNIGNVYKSQGKYEEAPDYYHRALEIDTRVSGSEHPDVATSYSNVGTVYDSQGRHEEAPCTYHPTHL